MAKHREWNWTLAWLIVAIIVAVMVALTIPFLRRIGALTLFGF